MCVLFSPVHEGPVLNKFHCSQFYHPRKRRTKKKFKNSFHFAQSISCVQVWMSVGTTFFWSFKFFFCVLLGVLCKLRTNFLINLFFYMWFKTKIGNDNFDRCYLLHVSPFKMTRCCYWQYGCQFMVKAQIRSSNTWNSRQYNQTP